MVATYEQAKKAQPLARALFEQIVPVRTVAIVRAAADGFGLRVDVANDPPAHSQFPDNVQGVPVQLRVQDDEIEAQAAGE